MGSLRLPLRRTAMRALSGGWDNTARLWTWPTGREIRKFEGHSAGSASVAFAPDGRTALSGGGDGTMRLWNIRSGEELAALIASPKRGNMTHHPERFLRGLAQGSRTCSLWCAGLRAIPCCNFSEHLASPLIWWRKRSKGDPEGKYLERCQCAKSWRASRVLSGSQIGAGLLNREQRQGGKAELAVRLYRPWQLELAGKVIWRVNGVAPGARLRRQALAGRSGPGRYVVMEQTLSFDPYAEKRGGGGRL